MTIKFITSIRSLIVFFCFIIFSLKRCKVIVIYFCLLSPLPLYYVGNPKNEETLQKIDDEINTLTAQRKAKEITEGEFTEKTEELKQKRNKIQSRPALNEVSTDMADNNFFHPTFLSFLPTFLQ